MHNYSNPNGFVGERFYSNPIGAGVKRCTVTLTSHKVYSNLSCRNCTQFPTFRLCDIELRLADNIKEYVHGAIVSAHSTKLAEVLLSGI